MVKKSGWVSDSKRHSNARKFGRAGGRYASSQPKKRFSRTAHALAVDRGIQATKVYDKASDYLKSETNRTDLNEFDTKYKPVSVDEKKKLLKKYLENEAINHHTENAVMLINRFGSEDEKIKAENMVKAIDKRGYVTESESKFFSKTAHTKYYDIITDKKKLPEYISYAFINGEASNSQIKKRFEELDESDFGYKTSEYKDLQKYMKSDVYNKSEDKR